MGFGWNVFGSRGEIFLSVFRLDRDSHDSIAGNFIEKKKTPCLCAGGEGGYEFRINVARTVFSVVFNGYSTYVHEPRET